MGGWILLCYDLFSQPIATPSLTSLVPLPSLKEYEDLLTQ